MRDLINIIMEAQTDAAYEDGRKFAQELQPFRSVKFSDPEFKPEIKNWPPSAQELREIERAVFQSPEWLNYWAQFEWRSFTRASKWHYNKNTDTFNFFDVPAISYFHDNLQPERAMIRIKSDGTVVPIESQYAHLHCVLPTALDACQAVVRLAAPKLRFLKGTYYIRFGMWPQNERSQNFLARGETVYEAGVSAYHADYNFETDRWEIDPSVDEAAVAGTLQTLIYSKRAIYLIQGREIKRTGADGEPLLRDVKLISQLPAHSVLVPGMFDPREDL